MALLLAVLVALYGSLGLGLQDDTFISLRYARNLVEGHGLVFNPGEPVEGYTNFLWTLLLAFVIRLGLNTLPTVVLLGTASAMALVMASRRLGPVGWAGWVCPVLLVGSAPLALESVQGL
ncbi:MAG: hypothetical protein QGG40_01415, partial [Myxococcota bacterium]|nr:hypothetical protein [Myxococcota bacterium]